MNVAIFFDYDTIENNLNDFGLSGLDYEALTDYLTDPNEGRKLSSAFCYISVEKNSKTSHDHLVEEFKNSGFIVREKEKVDGKYPTLDVDMVMDIYEVINNKNIDIITIFTNNVRFLPLIINLQNKGYRVEVVDFIRTKLSEESLGFIDLSEIIKEDIETLTQTKELEEKENESEE